MTYDENEMKEAMKRIVEINKRSKERKRTTPWQPEHIAEDWTAHGLRCLVVHGPMSLNGYVYVPEDHPWFGVDYSDCPTQCGKEYCHHSPESQINVHGGITFSQLGENGWIFGFDTYHPGDFMITPVSIEDGRKWEEIDVIAETELMAAQLAEQDKV